MGPHDLGEQLLVTCDESAGLAPVIDQTFKVVNKRSYKKVNGGLPGDVEYERLVRSAKIRGVEPRSNMHTYKTYAYLLGMLFVRAAARAERVQQAVELGFDGIELWADGLDARLMDVAMALNESNPSI